MSLVSDDPSLLMTYTPEGNDTIARRLLSGDHIGDTIRLRCSGLLGRVRAT